uniref:Cytochrome c oxidase subunit 6b-1-like n=1 Tax=Ananas comosus var. bracteatus TaxID=296719 RepID=A0A6V7QS25_ANACO
MAEETQEKTLTLAEQWSLQKEEDSGNSEVPVAEATEDEKPVDATPEETSKDEKPADAAHDEEIVSEKSDETETPATDETNPVVEENNETPEQEEEAEEKPEIKLETAPADFRFPTTNQTRHCFTRYIEYHRCIAAKGEGAKECEKFAKYYRSLCPGEWIERWNEQRENGTFPGPL